MGGMIAPGQSNPRIRPAPGYRLTPRLANWLAHTVSRPVPLHIGLDDSVIYNPFPAARSDSEVTHGGVMRVILNGNPDQLDDGATVADLLARLELEPIRVAVEINEDIVPRKTFPDKRIQDGDRIEVVTFVGGG
jgi:sulfur carrier protein